MKKIHSLCLASLLVLGWNTQGEALSMRFENSSAQNLPNNQLINVIVTDSQGHIFQQKIPYNASVGEIDINMGQIGPHASIYFPEQGTGYLWYNDHWVNNAGYYWNGQQRVYINDPNWKNYWVHYWKGSNYEKMRKGPWHQHDQHEGSPRYETQYSHGGYGQKGYETYGYHVGGHEPDGYRESNDQQKGRWQERRNFDGRAQRGWRADNQGYDYDRQRRGENRGRYNRSGQETWGEQSYGQVNQNDWRYQNPNDGQTSIGQPPIGQPAIGQPPIGQPPRTLSVNEEQLSQGDNDGMAVSRRVVGPRGTLPAHEDGAMITDSDKSSRWERRQGNQ